MLSGCGRPESGGGPGGELLPPGAPSKPREGKIRETELQLRERTLIHDLGRGTPRVLSLLPHLLLVPNPTRNPEAHSAVPKGQLPGPQGREEKGGQGI
jgi:hypothetical protein